MVGAMLALAGSAQAADEKTLVFVVNGASDFRKAAEAGVKKAQGELPNYKLDFKYPEQSSAAIQTRLMDDLVAAGVSGIMVSAVDPKTMGDALDRIGKQVALFTTDSDAPKSSRVAYIGSSNVDAGKQAGEIALKAPPNGGNAWASSVCPADNARERIEGFKDTTGLQDRARRRAPTTSIGPVGATSRTR
jgi:ribose transport system substrate-binding protein